MSLMPIGMPCSGPRHWPRSQLRRQPLRLGQGAVAIDEHPGADRAPRSGRSAPGSARADRAGSAAAGGSRRRRREWSASSVPSSAWSYGSGPASASRDCHARRYTRKRRPQLTTTSGQDDHDRRSPSWAAPATPPLELIKILLRHPARRDRGRHLAPGGHAAGRRAAPEPDRPHRSALRAVRRRRLLARGVQCVFGCLPHGASMSTLPALLERGMRVIDLSADYRLRDPNVYAQWYGESHRRPGQPGPGGLRPAGDLRRRDRDRPAGRQSRLLSADRHPRPGAAGGRQVHRPAEHHHRQQERRLRGGPDAEADHALSRVQRKRVGLQRRQASPHAGDRAGAGRRGRRAGRGDLHAAPDPDGPRHLLHHLRHAATGL